MSIADLIRKPSSEGFATATVATGATHPTPAWVQPGLERRTVATVASVAVANPRNAETAPHHAWRITASTGAVLEITCSPPTTRAEVEAWHPGADIEELPDRVGWARPPTVAADIINAWLTAIGETDPTTRAEILHRAAIEPDALAGDYRAAVAAGVATWDAPPTPAPDASCPRCTHFKPDPINPQAGLGRCLIHAPRSRQPGACWPRGEVRCLEYEARHE